MIRLIATMSADASVIRTFIFAFGHFFIDFFTIVVLTGSTIEASAQASIVAPILNGFWYYILDRLWTNAYGKLESYK